MGTHDAGTGVVDNIAGVGSAEENLTPTKNEVVVASAVEGRTETVKFLLFGLRINDHQVRICVFVLQRPDEVCCGIDFDSIVVAEHSVNMNDMALHVELDDLAAQAVRAVWRVIISVSDENLIT